MTYAATASGGRGASSARLVPAAGWVALLLGWEALARANAGSLVLAGPLDVMSHLVANVGLYARALAATLQSALLGFLLGNALAIALAALALLLPPAARMISALALVTFCLPLVATGPILRVLWGPGQGPQVTLAALAVLYTTFLATGVGLRAVPRDWLDLVRSYGRGRGAEIAHVRVRAALPYVLAGLRIAAPAAVLGAMVGEFTGAERGLGVLTVRAMGALDAPATWTCAALGAAVSIAAHAALGWTGRRLSPDPPPLLLAPPGGARPRSFLRRIGEAALAATAVLLLWQASMDAAGLSPFFAKRPLDVLAHFTTDAGAEARRAVLLGAFLETMAFAVPGLLAGLAAGAGLACLLVLVPPLAPPALALGVTARAVPIVATAPLLVLALGRGPVATVAIVALMTFFPTLIACLEGLRRTPGAVSDVFRGYAAGRWRLLVSARIPAMLPALFASARMAVPAAILAVTVAEWLATGRGIGALMALTASTSDYGMLWGATVLVAVAAVVGTAAVAALERRVLLTYAPEQLASA